MSDDQAYVEIRVASVSDKDGVTASWVGQLDIAGASASSELPSCTSVSYGTSVDDVYRFDVDQKEAHCQFMSVSHPTFSLAHGTATQLNAVPGEAIVLFAELAFPEVTSASSNNDFRLQLDDDILVVSVKLEAAGVRMEHADDEEGNTVPAKECPASGQYSNPMGKRAYCFSPGALQYTTGARSTGPKVDGTIFGNLTMKVNAAIPASSSANRQTDYSRTIAFWYQDQNPTATTVAVTVVEPLLNVIQKSSASTGVEHFAISLDTVPLRTATAAFNPTFSFVAAEGLMVDLNRFVACMFTAADYALSPPPFPLPDDYACPVGQTVRSTLGDECSIEATPPFLAVCAGVRVGLASSEVEVPALTVGDVLFISISTVADGAGVDAGLTVQSNASVQWASSHAIDHSPRSYESELSAMFNAPLPSMDFELVSTSVKSSPDNELAIGEEAKVRVTVKVAAAKTATAVRIKVPAGLSLSSSALVGIGNRLVPVGRSGREFQCCDEASYILPLICLACMHAYGLHFFLKTQTGHLTFIILRRLFAEHSFDYNLDRMPGAATPFPPTITPKFGDVWCGNTGCGNTGLWIVQNNSSGLSESWAVLDLGHTGIPYGREPSTNGCSRSGSAVADDIRCDDNEIVLDAVIVLVDTPTVMVGRKLQVVAELVFGEQTEDSIEKELKFSITEPDLDVIVTADPRDEMASGLEGDTDR